MRILLDTNVVLWAMSDSPKLTKPARREIQQASAVFVSAASIWEISIKAALGKLKVDIDEFVARLHEAGFESLPVTWKHAARVHALPHHHRDPFDRLLVAQALVEPLRLVTGDKLLTAYGDWIVCV